MRDQRRTHRIYVSANTIEGMSAPWVVTAPTWVTRTSAGRRPPNTVEYVRRDVVDKAIRMARRGARRKATRANV